MNQEVKIKCHPCPELTQWLYSTHYKSQTLFHQLTVYFLIKTSITAFPIVVDDCKSDHDVLTKEIHILYFVHIAY